MSQANLTSGYDLDNVKAGPTWNGLARDVRHRLLEDDLTAGRTVSGVLCAIVVLGTVLMFVTVLLAT